MSWWSDLFGSGTDGRETVAQSPAPPTASPAPASTASGVATTAAPYPSERLLGAVLAGVEAVNPDAWAASLAAACQANEITTTARVAAFLANVLHETCGFTQLKEDLNYSVSGLLTTFAGRVTEAQAAKLGRAAGKPALTLAQQLAIADVVYGGAWGLKNLGNKVGTTDARTFVGRGLVQLTGRSNYQQLAAAVVRDVDTLPAWLETMDGAAESAASYWRSRGCNAAADSGTVSTCRRLVAGCYEGVADVSERHSVLLVLLTRNTQAL